MKTCNIISVRDCVLKEIWSYQSCIFCFKYKRITELLVITTTLHSKLAFVLAIL